VGRRANPSLSGDLVNRINQALALLVSLLFVFLILEGGLRLFGFSPRRTMNQFDAALGWTKTPSTSLRRHTGEFDVTLQTNSRGLREDESLAYDKPAGTQRVLLVGDSFTLGYTVDRPDTLSELLEARMRAEGRSVEVINGGTEGYSTDQEVVWLAREGVKYSPDVIVLQMYENDVFWNGQASYLRYPKPKLRADLSPEAALPSLGALSDPGQEPWLERKTALGNLLGGMVGGPSVPILAGPRPLPAEWGPRIRDAEGDGWPETRLALQVFRLVAEQAGARPLVMVIPDKAQVDPRAREAIAEVIGDPGYDPDRPYRGMVAAAKAAGLPVVDTLPAMAAASQGGEQQLYFARDWHTNALGNRVLVQELDQALSSPALLGPPPREVARLKLPAPSAAAASNLARDALIAIAVWLVLGTLYWRRFPAEGALRSYASVAGLVCAVVLIVYAVGWLAWLLPLWIGRWVSTIVVLGVLGAAVWYLRGRLPVMAELFGTFVRRGQWYMLPVLVGLLSLGGLLVVAASSPWLAPFIYTLF
jgi:lysophospholipase L1-like esterase